MLLLANTGAASSEEINVTLESHFGGAIDAVEVYGDYACIGQGQDFVVLDISDSSSPTEIGRLTTSSLIQDVIVSGNYAYIADEYKGLVIIDISNPSYPTLAGSYDTTGNAWGVTVSGNYAYVADGSNGLVIVDISDSSSPTLVGSYDTGDARGVTVSGNYAYIADGSNGLVIIDISNPSSPTLAGSYDTGDARGVTVSGNYAYIADWDIFTNGLIIVDISNPSSPTLAGSYDTGDARSVTVSSNYAYVADEYKGLVIIDISNPSSPTLAGSYDTSGYAEGVTVSGNYAYVADSGNSLIIVDISNPSSPTLVGNYGTPAYASGVTVSSNYAYVADDYKGLIIIDISDPSSPTLAGSYDTGNANGLTVSGNYSYVADWDNGLIIVDISNPFSPKLAGSYDTTGNAMGVTISGNYAYVADRGNDLIIVDISNPSSPTLAGSYGTTDWAMDVTVSGNYAYVANGYNGLIIVDISDPSSPTLAGSYDTSRRAMGVTISGNYAYVADRGNGLVIVDISDPSSPTLAGSYDTSGCAEGVTISGNYAYVADWDNGLVIVDISNPSSPTLVGSYNTNCRAEGVTVSGNYAYVADWGNGLMIFNIENTQQNIQKPDIIVGDMWWDKEIPKVGDELTLSYKIDNIGDNTTNSEFTNQLYIDGELLSCSTSSNMLGSGDTQKSNFADTWRVTSGKHTIKIIADAFSETDDLDTSNNILTKELSAINLEGRVISNSSGNGISNVTVMLSDTGMKATTTPDGYYTFANVPLGEYTLTFSKKGYYFNTTTVDISINNFTTADTAIGDIDHSVINAEIIQSDQSSIGSTYVVGDEVSINYTIKNTGSVTHTFYAGYSVREFNDEGIWDAPYKSITLAPGETEKVKLSWVVNEDVSHMVYDKIIAVWAEQQNSRLYDQIDKEVYEATFNVIDADKSIPGWYLCINSPSKVAVEGNIFTAIPAYSSGKFTWLILDEDGNVESDLDTYKKAAEAASMSRIPSNTNDDLRNIKENFDKFNQLTFASKSTLWIRDTGAYLLGKYTVIAATGGSSLSTELTTSVAKKEAAKIATREIAKEYSQSLLNNLESHTNPELTESKVKDLLWGMAVSNMYLASDKLENAIEVIETHNKNDIWTYDEAHRFHQNYDDAVSLGMANMNLSSELLPASDFCSQVTDITKKSVSGASSGLIDFDETAYSTLESALSDMSAVKKSGTIKATYEELAIKQKMPYSEYAEDLQKEALQANFVKVSAACPVNVHAYDEFGRHVGVNSSGMIDLQIPGSYYTGHDSEPEQILIFNQSANLTFEIEALDEGEFDFTLVDNSRDKITTANYANISIKDTTVSTVCIDQNKTSYSMMVDIDGDGSEDHKEEPIIKVEVNNNPPTANISSISPNPATEIESVIFNGSCNDSDGTILRYNWTSSIDGHLSTSANFSTSGLSVGTHNISFRVQDNVGVWSDPVSTTLIVEESSEELKVKFESYFGGEIDAVEVHGNYAYVGQGQDLVVLDISDISNPTEIGRLYITSMSVISKIAVSDNHAYIADYSKGLIIVDISDPSSPALAGSYYSYGVWDVTVSGNHAYVADWNNGLLIVDISDPSSPALAGSHDTGDAEDVTVSGNYAYVAAGSNGLLIFDISDPFSPTLAGSYDTISYVWSVTVSDNYAYMADGENGLVIVDISSSYAPTLVGSFDTDGYAGDVTVAGNYAYVADDINGLAIVDVSDSTNPTLAGSYDTISPVWRVTVSDNYAYLASNNLIILKIENSQQNIQKSEVSRYVLETAFIGDNTTVDLYIKVGSNATKLIIEETAPSGWIVTSADNGGIIDGNTVTWVEFEVPGDDIYSYTVQIPANTTPQNYEFSGQFDMGPGVNWQNISHHQFLNPILPLNPYDFNANCIIEISEISAAVDDFLNGYLSIIEISELIDYFLSGDEYR